MKKKLLVLAIFFIVLMTSVAASATKGQGDVFRFMKEYTVVANEEISGSIFVIGGNVNIEKNASVTGDVITIFGNLKVDGRVNKNIVALFGNVEVSDSASVIGDCAVIFGKLKAVENVILGERFSFEGAIIYENGLILPIIATGVISLMVITFAVFCLVYFIFKSRIEIIANSIPEDIGRKFTIGLLIKIAFIPLVLTMIITVVGIFLIPIIFALYMALNLIASVALCLVVGRRIKGEKTSETCGNPYISMLSGFLVLFILSIIPVVGWLFYLGINCIATGAVVDTRIGKAV